ncbi:MAG: acyltransferase family protein [Bacteriovorax sp.]|nr:acyltransferase family protein [Rhizobacter sp.]
MAEVGGVVVAAVVGTAASSRRPDLDGLRIAALALLIGCHVGMLYVPWAFQVKSDYRSGLVLTAIMLVLNPWRLSLLFVISGVVFGVATGFLAMRGERMAALGGPCRP